MRRFFGVVLSWLLCGQAVAVPEFHPPADAKIGLVLSGGGARGLAHIGVLRVLEAHGIKANIVTGTSMGAIIGALYASGHSADEIEQIALQMDWHDAFVDRSARRSQPYPFRQLEAGMSADFRIWIGSNGVALPKGMIQGQHLELVLGSLFRNHGAIMQIEDLPIQFAAVAADLETGEQVVMTQGDLASAVRASMSIPGALAPVVRDGKLLVDGGIANNMPVDLARQMGATVIIAVDVASPLQAKTELQSILAIAGQTTAFLVKRNTEAQRGNLHEGDAIVTPDLQGISATDFDKAAELIEAGASAAAAVFGRVPDVRTTTAVVGTDMPARAEVVDQLTILNDSSISDAVIRKAIRQREGEPYNEIQLLEDIEALYGLDYFSLVRYRLYRTDNQQVLEVNCIARETGNNGLKLGLEVAEDFRGNSEFSLAGSLRSSGLNSHGGTAFTRLQIGSSLAFEARFLQPLDAGLRYFVEPSIGYDSDPIDLYTDFSRDYPVMRLQHSKTWASLALGRLLWRQVAEMRMGATMEKGDLDYRGGQPFTLSRDEANYEDGFFFGRLGWDTLDDLGFPSEGARWSLYSELHTPTLKASGTFHRAATDFTFSVGSKENTLLFEGDAEYINTDSANYADIPFIGGFLELSGLPPRSLFGNHRGLVRAVYLHRMDEQGALPLGIPFYFGMSLEKGNVWLLKEDISLENTINAGSLFLGARTPLGPAYLSVGMTDTGERSVAIFLGQRFR